ncbi:MAG TPA: trehalase family glycosidase [Terracidiphilus sp.]|nr:trehalase family glycosidase [Terracidiphilus sp.]
MLATLALTLPVVCAAGTRPQPASLEGAPSSADARYQGVQAKLAQGWNTWDVNSMTTHVLLPEGLAIHVGFKHNTTLYGDEFLARTSVGQGTIFPGPHAWDGSYTQLKVTWKGHQWRVESAHEGRDLVLLITPLDAPGKFALPATVVFSVDFVWDRPGTALKHAGIIETHGDSGAIRIYCTCGEQPITGASGHDAAHPGRGQLPVSGAYLAAELTQPIGLSTGRQRSVAEISAILERQRADYRKSTGEGRASAPTVDAIETTLGWDTIYDPGHRRVISPVSRDWSIGWGGYVLFDWDTFFGATLAGIGDRNLAYANVIEILKEETPEGFVPNYARAGDWKSSDRSEPPVGAITVLGLYRKYGDRWFLEETYAPLLRWNRWWAEHRDIQGYLTWGSDGENQPADLEDNARGTRGGAILESGLDNSPMYDDATYDSKTHVLEFADVGLMSLYIADCDSLASIADTLQKPEDAKSLRERSDRYRGRLASLWSEDRGIFLNKDLHTGQFSTRLSPTNFYPLMAHQATAEQAQRMVKEHLLNPKEFWGQWVIPAISRDDPAFKDQNYWRGRIWGPMNYLVYLGLSQYPAGEIAAARRETAQKSFALFSKEWSEKGHVHENYNAMQGTGDDVTSSDRFYHWGALLGYIQYLEETRHPE